MALQLLKDKGTPLTKQGFTWRDLVQPPYSKLDDDAFTRVRVILMNGIEAEALRFSHACARCPASRSRNGSTCLRKNKRGSRRIL